MGRVRHSLSTLQRPTTNFGICSAYNLIGIYSGLVYHAVYLPWKYKVYAAWSVDNAVSKYKVHAADL